MVLVFSNFSLSARGAEGLAWSGFLVLVVSAGVFLLSFSPAFGRPISQESEKFILGSHSISLQTAPLEPVLAVQAELAQDLRNQCDQNWRGYVGSWQMIDRQLHLVQLKQPCSDSKTRMSISRLFPKEKLPIKASWFSGFLRIGPHSRFKGRSLVLRLESGRLVDQRLVSDTEQRLQLKKIVSRAQKDLARVWNRVLAAESSKLASKLDSVLRMHQHKNQPSADLFSGPFR